MTIPATTPAQPSLFDTLPEAPDALDRGECGELDADTMKRCTGRRKARYVSLAGQVSFAVWRCDVCGNQVVP